jgi:hypothetical protein
MVVLLIVDKGGSVKEVNVKNVIEDELYKKCGYKKPDGFALRNKWIVKLKKNINKTFNIELYAKDEGRANSENKYDFPPPVDTILLFGNCLLINKDEHGNIDDLSKDIWEMIYEKLFGGFEDLNVNAEEDEYEEDELENIPIELKTKEGYLKDDFVIDLNSDDELDDEAFTDELDELDDDDGDDDEEDEEDDVDDDVDDDDDDDDDDDMFDESGSEISEEQYIYSDEEK